ncbi:MAG TPA: hypothetical protein VGG28_21635 [Kofleriaceae bacterium]|jgi:hypothetical protein
MNRRIFLGASVVSFGLAATPAWIQQAFAGEPSSKTLVFDAYRRARSAARPLLIFVIPVEPDERWHRGHALGSFITYANDAQLAPLAHCEVVCATAAHVHELVPNAPAGEPLALLVDTTAVPAHVRAITVALADPAAARSDATQNWDQRQAAADDIVMANVGAISQALDAALGAGDPKLADDVRARLSKRDVPGARWASSAGCGVAFEHPDKGDENMGMVDCGMGFVSEKSTRFLELLASPAT